MTASKTRPQQRIQVLRQRLPTLERRRRAAYRQAQAFAARWLSNRTREKHDDRG